MQLEGKSAVLCLCKRLVKETQLRRHKSPTTCWIQTPILQLVGECSTYYKFNSMKHLLLSAAHRSRKIRLRDFVYWCKYELLLAP